MYRESLATNAAGAQDQHPTARFSVETYRGDDRLFEPVGRAEGLDLVAQLDAGIQRATHAWSENAGHC